MKVLNILVLDDDPVQIELLKVMFDGIDYPPCKVDFASTGESFNSLLAGNQYDLVISDYFMPDVSGKEILKRVKIDKPECEVIILTSGTTTKEAIELMKNGAYDFIVKPISIEILQNRLAKIFELKSLVKENAALLKKSADVNISLPGNIIYKSKEMEGVINIAARAAGTNSNILLKGESGTGKELLAQAIHSTSLRRNNLFVTINIAALPEGLIESELFGHVRGAFTGAHADRIGRFEEADGGTIFIDEAGDIPQGVQVKLLRLIQFGEFQKVGSNQTQRVDTRIIAATNKNLDKMIERGEFREDLFYRLNVIPIEIPPLRERRGDIPLLVDYFLGVKSSELGREKASLTDEAYNLLIKYNYPGNIRELENIIEYAIAIARTRYITTEELPSFLKRGINTDGDTPTAALPRGAQGGGYDEEMTGFERALLMNALRKFEGNQSSAARFLGISERRLRSRMDILKLKNPFKRTTR